MAWAYVVLFNEKIGTRDEVQDFLDGISEVPYWYGCMPNSVFFTSTLTAGQMAEKFKEKYGTNDGQRFFITEVHSDRQGWMPKNVWHMLKNPDDPRMK